MIVGQTSSSVRSSAITIRPAKSRATSSASLSSIARPCAGGDGWATASSRLRGPRFFPRRRQRTSCSARAAKMLVLDFGRRHVTAMHEDIRIAREAVDPVAGNRIAADGDNLALGLEPIAIALPTRRERRREAKAIAVVTMSALIFQRPVSITGPGATSSAMTGFQPPNDGSMSRPERSLHHAAADSSESSSRRRRRDRSRQRRDGMWHRSSRKPEKRWPRASARSSAAMVRGSP